MSKKLYVGNVTYEMTNVILEEPFTPFVAVRPAQVIQGDTGATRDFALWR